MQLVPVTSTPEILTANFDGHPVRVTNIDGRPWLVAADLAQPLGIGRNAVRMQTSDLTPEDVRAILIDTNKGSRQATIVSESGAYQLIVQSRKPTAARLRKFICDIFVKWGRQELAPATPVIDYTALAGIVATAVTEAMKPVLMALNRTQAVLPAKHVPLSELPVWTAAEHGRMRSAGFITCADLLARMKGQQVHHATSGGLTRRVLRWCEEKGVAVHRFRRGQSTKFIYVPEQAAKLVLRTGWAAKSSVMAEAQAELFPEAV